MQRNLPVGIIVIAICAFFLAGGLLIFWGLLGWLIPGFQAGAASVIVIGLLVLGLGIFRIAVGWGLVQLRNWARIAAIVLVALDFVLNLIFGLVAVVALDVLLSAVRVTGAAPGWIPAVAVIGFLILLAISAVIIWYLLRTETVQAFEEGGFGQAGWVPPYDVGMVATDVASYGGGMIETEVASPAPPPPPPLSPQPEHKPIQRTMADRVTPAAAGWLHVRSGPRTGKSTTLSTTARTTLGRDGTRCELILEDPAVSAEHACVQWENGRFVLYDMASRNGTFVNDARVQRQALLDGDSIRIGNTTLVFKSVM